MVIPDFDVTLVLLKDWNDTNTYRGFLKYYTPATHHNAYT